MPMFPDSISTGWPCSNILRVDNKKNLIGLDNFQFIEGFHFQSY